MPGCLLGGDARSDAEADEGVDRWRPMVVVVTIGVVDDGVSEEVLWLRAGPSAPTCPGCCLWSGIMVRARLPVSLPPSSLNIEAGSAHITPWATPPCSLLPKATLPADHSNPLIEGTLESFNWAIAPSTLADPAAVAPATGCATLASLLASSTRG